MSERVQACLVQYYEFNYNLGVEVPDHGKIIGIQRDCIKKPPDVADGDCIKSVIQGVKGSQCFCTTNNCNIGDAPYEPDNNSAIKFTGNIMTTLILTTIFYLHAQIYLCIFDEN